MSKSVVAAIILLKIGRSLGAGQGICISADTNPFISTREYAHDARIVGRAEELSEMLVLGQVEFCDEGFTEN